MDTLLTVAYLLSRWKVKMRTVIYQMESFNSSPMWLAFVNEKKYTIGVLSVKMRKRITMR